MSSSDTQAQAGQAARWEQFSGWCCYYCKDFTKSPMTCRGCGCIAYCSEDCRRMHWEGHRSLCRRLPGLNGVQKAATPRNLDFHYFRYEAPRKGQAQALAKRLNLDFSVENGPRYIRPEALDCFLVKSLTDPLRIALRKLVSTVNDSPENMAIFFGTMREEETKKIRQNYRMQEIVEDLRRQQCTPGPDHSTLS